MNDFWQKQSKETPLFANIIWSRPINKRLLKNLLILGGNIHAINAPSLAYSETLKQKIGNVKVLLPDKTAKLFPQKINDIEFLPGNQTGSFGLQSLDEIKTRLNRFDGVLFAGDFGKNSETWVMLEKLATMPGLQVYTKDSLDIFCSSPDSLLGRNNTLLVIDFARIQKFIAGSGYVKPLTSGIELLQMVNLLHDFTLDKKSILLTMHNQIYYLAFKGQVITTKIEPQIDWPILAAAASVWWVQNPAKPLEAIATAVTQV